MVTALPWGHSGNIATVNRPENGMQTAEGTRAASRDGRRTSSSITNVLLCTYTGARRFCCAFAAGEPFLGCFDG